MFIGRKVQLKNYGLETENVRYDPKTNYFYLLTDYSFMTLTLSQFLELSNKSRSAFGDKKQ